jgi:hypothetical protein
MKNVERVSNTSPAFRVPLYGAPPLKGWAVRYVSGISDPEIKSGFWLSQWYLEPDKASARFNFESELFMCYNDESVATRISDALRQHCEIETEVVHLL